MSTFSANILTDLKTNRKDAIAKVYELYYKQLCYFADKIIENNTIAEDVVADVFLDLIRKPMEFNSIPSLKSFLYIAIRNRCIDHLRLVKRQTTDEQINEYSDKANINIENTIIASEVLQAIYTAIDQLPQKYRNIIFLSLVEGHDNQEIVNKTGLAYQTVRNLKSAGIKLLRVTLYNNGTLPMSTLILTLLLLETKK